MRSWPGISFRYSHYPTANRKEKAKLNFFCEQTDQNGEENYARCTRLSSKERFSPGKKPLNNLSTMQNPLAVSKRCCRIGGISWEEDFIDLTDFCQPSNVLIKMEDSVDECTASPVNTGRSHGLDYSLEVNDFDHIDENLWCMPSQMPGQDEFGDPISVWWTATKEANNYNNNNNIHNRPGSSSNCNTINADSICPSSCNTDCNEDYSVDNFASSSEISYDLNDVLFNTHQVLVPTPNSQCDKKSDSHIDKMISPSLHLSSESVSFFQTESAFSQGKNDLLTENLGFTRPETTIRLPPADCLFPIKHRDTAHDLQSHQFLEGTSPLSEMLLKTSNKSVFPDALTSLKEKSMSAKPLQVNERVKSNIDRPSSGSSIGGPEVLPPFNKNDFDLVSYVFKDNKCQSSSDISNLENSNANDESSRNVSAIITKPSPVVTIKTEPKDEAVEEHCSIDGPNGKHSVDKNEYFLVAKRSRRYSNCSSEDLTQLESEKYRELRNKNNEASKRSRANRKTREVEMREHASKLESENRRLKVKAEEMENLVKRLRQCLMQLVLKRR